MKVKMKVEMKTTTTTNGMTDVVLDVCVDFELSSTLFLVSNFSLAVLLDDLYLTVTVDD